MRARLDEDGVFAVLSVHEGVWVILLFAATESINIVDEQKEE